MSIFDEMVAVLHEINQKLGENAGEKASVLDTKSVQELQKEKKDSGFKDNNAYLVSGFREALNNVPVFNKLASALSGLSPILRGLVGGAGLLGAENLMKKTAAATATAHGSTAFGNSSAALAALKEIPASKQLNKMLGVYAWKHLFSNVKDAGLGLGTPIKHTGQAMASFYKDVIASTTAGKPAMGDVFKDLKTAFMGGSGSKGILKETGGALGILGEGMNMGMVLKLAVIPGIIIGVGTALLKLAKSIAESQRNLAQYSGQIAYTFAISDVKAIFRDMTSANARQDSLSKFMDAWNDLLDKWKPIEDMLVNSLMELGTTLAEVASMILGAFEWLPKDVQKEAIQGGVDLVIGGPVLGFADMIYRKYKEATGGDHPGGLIGGAIDEVNKKDHNAIAGAMDKVKEAAQAAKNYYTDGIMGAGDFMMHAASWNFDPNQRRASDANHNLWSDGKEGKTMQRHG
jgi:hypothetical protein